MKEREIQEEKRRLVLECACDRLHWQVQRLRAQQRVRTKAGEVGYWLELLDRLAGPFFPRWWRVASAVFRRWVG